MTGPGAPAGYPAYEVLRPVLPYASVLLARNPSPMTLDGTNTWLLRAPGEDTCVVVDPGPDDDTHLRAVAEAAGRVAVTLLTHGHSDHSAGARAFHELTGAPVRALDPAHRYGGEGLSEGDVVAAGGVEVRVAATPGHTGDSVCFLVAGEAPAGSPDGSPGAAAGVAEAVLTGDTILGRGTTVITRPGGRLRDYLDTLRRLRELSPATVLPGHGPELPDAGTVAELYLRHRQARLEQVRAVAATLEPPVSATDVVRVVYADVDPALWRPAEWSVRAMLDYLAEERAGD